MRSQRPATLCMKFNRKRLFLLLLPLVLYACDAGGPPRLSEARITLPPPGMQMAAGYFELRNPGNQLLTVNSVRCPAFETVEIHETVQVDGLSRMRQIKDLSVPPRGRLRFEPGGMHLMMMGYRKDPSAFRNLPVIFTLKAEDGTTQELEAPFIVQDSGATSR